MTELEKAEKLREKANVSYAEAKEALDRSGGDLLDALIYLEKKGSANPPTGGGFYSGAGASSWGNAPVYGVGAGAKGSGESFGDIMRKFGRFCVELIHKGTVNFLDATKNGVPIFSCPVIVLVVLLLFFFWVTLPLFIISLFFGIRYNFSGPDLGHETKE